MSNATETDIPIRWLIRCDMVDVLRIESASFDNPWIEDDFLNVMRQRNCNGMVAELAGRVVGFMIYELHKGNLEILDFAVDPRYRRQGVGRQMVDRLKAKLSQQDRLKAKLSQQGRTELRLLVRERNLVAQLFFRSQEFLAVDVLSNEYDDTDEDAYVMRYRLLPEVIS